MVGSFYDPELEEGCAFEELICFHGGHRRPADAPVHPPPVAPRGPTGPILGAASVHGILAGWRKTLQTDTNGAGANSHGQESSHPTFGRSG